jgi:hypothetical protein
MYSKYPRIDKEIILKYHGRINCYHLLSRSISATGYFTKIGGQTAEKELNGGLIFLVRDYYGNYSGME